MAQVEQLVWAAPSPFSRHPDKYWVSGILLGYLQVVILIGWGIHQRWVWVTRFPRRSDTEEMIAYGIPWILLLLWGIYFPTLVTWAAWSALLQTLVGICIVISITIIKWVLMDDWYNNPGRRIYPQNERCLFTCAILLVLTLLVLFGLQPPGH